MKVKDIRVGNRHRQHVGDVRSLAASIAKLGLLHPVVVDAKGRLVAGARRLAAVKALGWKDVPVRVVRTLTDAASALRAERDENTERKSFLPSELVSVARALEPLERAEAKGRQGTRTDQHPGKLPGSTKGDRRDKLAAVVGVSGRTLDKARAVVEAAERDPKKYGRLLDQMDRSGNVNGAFRDLETQRQADSIAAEPPPLPAGPFRVIVADVPWHYALRAHDITHRGKPPYPTMSVEEISALPVQELAAKDCVLWLWTTNAHMREAFAVLDAWGFEPKTILTWAKQKFGVGQWLRGQTEHCHLAVRGKPTVLLTNQSTLLVAPTGAHSEKPEAFYQLVERMCPGSKVELFARRKRRGFVAHGNAVSGVRNEHPRPASQRANPTTRLPTASRASERRRACGRPGHRVAGRKCLTESSRASGTTSGNGSPSLPGDNRRAASSVRPVPDTPVDGKNRLVAGARRFSQGGTP